MRDFRKSTVKISNELYMRGIRKAKERLSRYKIKSVIPAMYYGVNIKINVTMCTK